MLYKITFYYTEPATGQTLKLIGIGNGKTPGEAEYYFKKQYPRHNITITNIIAI